MERKKDYMDMDFEFQICSEQLRIIDDFTSPADELFYKGKLLPLCLPPRSPTTLRDEPYIGNTIASTATATATPYESCNVSPAASCFFSGELSRDDDCFSDIHPPRARKSWTNKIRLVKQYLRSLFAKSARSVGPRAVPEANHRRSFSGAIKRRSSNKSSLSSMPSCSSSSSASFSSNNSSEAHGPQSVDPETERSIQGAIAYCNKSRQEVRSRKTASDAELYALSDSRIDGDWEKQENPEICRVFH